LLHHCSFSPHLFQGPPDKPSTGVAPLEYRPMTAAQSICVAGCVNLDVLQTGKTSTLANDTEDAEMR
jgi:hypothetical protein